MKKHNFNAGPSILPREVIENTAQAILDFNGSGLSLMEISHRAKDFQPVVDEAVALFKELLNIPEGYSVLFLGGGASLEFCMVPFNFLEKKAAYLNTGVWAKKAMKEAKAFGEVVEVLRLHISCDTIKSGHTIMCIPYLQRITRHGDTALHVIQHHVQRNAVPPARIRKIEH